MNRSQVRRVLGWVLVAVGVLGLIGAAANVRVLLDPGSGNIALATSAWTLVSSVIYVFAGIGTLRDARWPWAALLGTFAIQMSIFVMNLIGNPSPGGWRWVQFAFLVPNLVWLWVLLRPSVRSAFQPLPCPVLDKMSGQLSEL